LSRFIASITRQTRSLLAAQLSLVLVVVTCLVFVPEALGQEAERVADAAHLDQPGRLIAREEIDSGIVEALESARGTVVIEGYRYVLAQDVPVQMNGVAAAAADLAVGMQVQFRFLRVAQQLPRLLEVRVVPPEHRIYRR
jgi:hypothetical protein